MAPTLTVNDACIVNPFAYSNRAAERFDIVVFQAPDDVKSRTGQRGDILFIKRVIGLPGEKVEIRNNDVYINGLKLEEPFQVVKDDKDRKKDFGPITVPSEEYFLLGDNRPYSEDSRHYQHPTIRKDDIYSKVTEIKSGYYSKK
jgi:signal peptidase I